MPPLEWRHSAGNYWLPAINFACYIRIWPIPLQIPFIRKLDLMRYVIPCNILSSKHFERIISKNTETNFNKYALQKVRHSVESLQANKKIWRRKCSKTRH